MPVETLREKQTRFALAVPGLLQKTSFLGYGVTLGEAWRTQEQADWDAEHHTGIAHSLHDQRLAIDLLLFDAQGNYIENGTGYTELGEYWKSLGPDHYWGGDFESRDFDHFSLSPDGGKTR